MTRELDRNRVKVASPRKDVRAKVACESLEGRALLSGFADAGWHSYQVTRNVPSQGDATATADVATTGVTARAVRAAGGNLAMHRGLVMANSRGAGMGAIAGGLRAARLSQAGAISHTTAAAATPMATLTPAVAGTMATSAAATLPATNPGATTPPNDVSGPTPQNQPEMGGGAFGLAQLVGLDLGTAAGLGMPGGPAGGPGGPGGGQGGFGGGNFGGPGGGRGPGGGGSLGFGGPAGQMPMMGAPSATTKGTATSTDSSTSPTLPTLPAAVTTAQETLKADLDAALPAGFKSPSKDSLDALQADLKAVKDGTLTGTDADTKIQADKDAILASTGLTTDQVTAVDAATKQLDTDMKAIKDGTIASADADAKIKADKDAILTAAGFTSDQVAAIDAAQDQLKTDREALFDSKSSDDAKTTLDTDRDNLLVALGVSQSDIDKIKADTTALEDEMKTAFADSGTTMHQGMTLGMSTPMGVGARRFGRG